MTFPGPVAIPAWLTRYLDCRHARYRLLFHSPTHDAQETAEVEHVTANWSVKVAILHDHRGAVMLAMPADALPDAAKIATLTGRPALRRARRGELARLFPGVDPEVIPPLQIWPYVELWMDPTLEHDGPILFPAGTHRASVEMEFAEWMRVATPIVGRFVVPTYLGA